MYAPYLTSRWTSWPRRAGPAQWSHPCARGHRHRASGCRLCVSVCPTHTQTWCVLLALECHKEWGPPWRQRSTCRSGEEKGKMRVRQRDKYFTSRQFLWNTIHNRSIIQATSFWTLAVATTTKKRLTVKTCVFATAPDLVCSVPHDHTLTVFAFIHQENKPAYFYNTDTIHRCNILKY